MQSGYFSTKHQPKLTKRDHQLPQMQGAGRRGIRRNATREQAKAELLPRITGRPHAPATHERPITLKLEELAAIGRFWWRSMIRAVIWKSDPQVIMLMNKEWLAINEQIRDGKYVR